MDRKNMIFHNVFVFKPLLSTPLIRLKRFFRNMKILKIMLSTLVATSCMVGIVTLKLYYRHRASFKNQSLSGGSYKEIHVTTELIEFPIKHIDLNEIYKNSDEKDKEYDSLDVEEMRPVLLLDTEGCKIPLEMVDYENRTTNKLKTKFPCGKRAVFLTKFNHVKVKFSIKSQDMKMYLINSTKFECCYRFIVDGRKFKDKPLKSRYTSYKKVEDNSIVTLESDFINVKCSEISRPNVTHEVYNDYYAFSKKNSIPTKPKQNNCTTKYNVLMIGMDSMSVPRFAKTMPRSKAYLLDNYWLIYRGYHKVADNTYPNLMTAITGKNVTMFNHCQSNMDECQDFIIWKKFKDDGYVTAYGEDFLWLPDTFNTFRRPPTDHFMRPLFMKSENTAPHDKGALCAGKVSTGQQILDFALDFANTYKEDSFFGIFWINSFSHNLENRPEDADVLIENFFNRLTYTGVMKNTFVIFFSDHGLRFGHLRLPMEGYYDERLPMLFIWPAIYFKSRHPIEFRSLAFNQYKLVTPYDLYSTLFDIQRISLCENATRTVVAEGCPNCQSMFELISDKRTCQDVGISEKWCSCHKLIQLPRQDTYGNRAVDSAVLLLNNRKKKIKTKQCWTCANIEVKKIIRIHCYQDGIDPAVIFYVVAFVTAPSNMAYEASVKRRVGSDNVTVVGPISILSVYGVTGACALKSVDRSFCSCQRVQKCPVTINKSSRRDRRRKLKHT